MLSHQRLYEQLETHASKWRKIGTHLDFHQTELDNIQSMPSCHMDAPYSLLSAMLKQWLEWAPGDHRGSKDYATLERLKSAVDKAGLGKTAKDLCY